MDKLKPKSKEQRAKELEQAEELVMQLEYQELLKLKDYVDNIVRLLKEDTI